MPGVSANESNEIIVQLQEIGQIISQETSQLVDALMNLTLDQEDTDRSITRMSLDASLAQGEIEKQAQSSRDLQAEVDAERKKNEQAEHDFRNLTEEFKTLRDTTDKKNSESSDDGVISRNDTIRARTLPSCCVSALKLICSYRALRTQSGTWKTK